MTNEELERKIEFLNKQQDSFSDTLQDVVNKLHDVAERQDKLAERQDKFQEEMEALKARQDQTQTQINSLNQAMVGLFAITTDLSKRVEEMTEAQKQTSERLDIFINVVERYITENRNGKKSPSTSPRTKRSRSGGQGRRKQS